MELVGKLKEMKFAVAAFEFHSKAFSFASSPNKKGSRQASLCHVSTNLATTTTV